jgi:hypothetical protein
MARRTVAVVEHRQRVAARCDSEAMRLAAQCALQGMRYPDIERARERHSVLRRTLDGYVGPGADLRRLRRVVDLCRELSDTTEDTYCREKVHAIAEYSAELLSQAEHRARGALSGVDFLRQQIRAGLELVESRLYSLERLRRHGGLGRARLARPSAFNR